MRCQKVNDRLIYCIKQNLREGRAMDWWICFFILLFCTVMYLLYIKGLAASKSIQAILCVFRPGKDADRVTLDSCTGWVRHVGRFHGDRTYEFTFDCQLSKGDAEVFLLDRHKQQLLKLNRQFPTGRAELGGKSIYYLRWEFKNATGKCELHW